MTVPSWRVVANSRGDVAELSAVVAAANIEHVRPVITYAGSGVRIELTVLAVTAGRAELYAVGVLGNMLDRPVCAVSSEPAWRPDAHSAIWESPRRTHRGGDFTAVRSPAYSP